MQISNFIFLLPPENTVLLYYRVFDCTKFLRIFKNNFFLIIFCIIDDVITLLKCLENVTFYKENNIKIKFYRQYFTL